jgi:HK97 family phage major capsid protein
VVDTQLFNGNGTGKNLKGVLQYAPAFDAGSFAGSVEDPTRADVLRVAYNQIIIALFRPTAICLHPTDVAKMELEKDANGNSVIRSFVAANGLTIKGLPVIENIGVAEGSFLIGDFSRMGVFAKGGVVLEIGRDKDDFSTDQVTVKLRERLACRIKGRDLKAFVKGTFNTAIAAIATA